MTMIKIVDTFTERPAGADRIHFSINGGISLISRLPAKVIRSGDTASSSEEGGLLLLWSCTRRGHEFHWMPQAWTEEKSQACLERADIMVIIGMEPGEIANSLPKRDLPS